MIVLLSPRGILATRHTTKAPPIRSAGIRTRDDDQSPTPEAQLLFIDDREVFWLTVRPTSHAFSGRLLGWLESRALRANTLREWLRVAFVPDYSGGSAVVLHHL